FAVAGGKVWRVRTDGGTTLLVEKGATTIAHRGAELLIGTHDGYYGIDPSTGSMTTPLQTRLPVTDITRIVPTPDGLWFGTTRGAFRLRATNQLSHPALPDGPNGARYYASQRWLKDDSV